MEISCTIPCRWIWAQLIRLKHIKSEVIVKDVKTLLSIKIFLYIQNLDEKELWDPFLTKCYKFLESVVLQVYFYTKTRMGEKVSDFEKFAVLSTMIISAHWCEFGAGICEGYNKVFPSQINCQNLLSQNLNLLPLLEPKHFTMTSFVFSAKKLKKSKQNISWKLFSFWCKYDAKTNSTKKLFMRKRYVPEWRP